MKRYLLLLAAITLLFSESYSQEKLENHKVDSNVSIKLPGSPNEKIPGSLIAASPDSSVIYIATVVDFKTVAGIDSTGLAPIKETPEFAAQLKNGVQSKLHDVDLSDFKIGKWHNLTRYTSAGPGIGLRKGKYYEMFMFIIGSKFYSMTIVAPINNHELLSRDFFNSITIN